MTQVTRPDPLDHKVVDELAEVGIDVGTNTAEPSAPARILLERLWLGREQVLDFLHTGRTLPQHDTLPAGSSTLIYLYPTLIFIRGYLRPHLFSWSWGSGSEAHMPHPSRSGSPRRHSISHPSSTSGDDRQHSTPDSPAVLQALSENALHITVYDLLAHAYDRVAIQYYHDQRAAPLVDQQRLPAPKSATILPHVFQREVVAALLADSARALATFFGFEEMNFLLLDHPQKVYRLVVREGMFFPKFQPGIYTQPFGTGLLGMCHTERRTVLFNDVSQADRYVRTDPAVRAELAVPVVLGEEVLAIIDSGATQVGVFTPAHAAFIEGFARYLAPSIADPLAFLRAWRPGLVRAPRELAPLAQSLNFLYSWHEEWRLRFAQLYTEVAQRNTELIALIGLSEALSTSLRLDTILSTTVAKVAQILSCQVSWILLPDDEGRLHIRALHGGSADGLVEAGIAPDGSPQFAAFPRGEAVITNDLSRLPHSCFDWAFCQRNEITRYVTVPLRVRERTIGVMNVGRRHTTEDLGEQDVRLLSTFANQIALAIENADLYERSRVLGALEERNRLARDLHDTLVQSIVGIVRSFDGIEALIESAPRPLRKAVLQARELARVSLDEARRSVWNLHLADDQDSRPLWDALEAYIATWSQRTGVAASFHKNGQSILLDPGSEVNLLHIVQEALSNVARHASAHHVSVSLDFGSAGLRLVISDDGAGFLSRREAPDMRNGRDGGISYLPVDPADGGGFGLQSMRERAVLLGGRLHIESTPGWGARVVLTLPTTTPSGADTLSHLPEQHVFGRLASASQAAGHPLEKHRQSPLPLGTITVLLADDHPAMREGIRMILDQVTSIQVVGVATSGAEAAEMARALCPDVLLLDVQLPDEDGIDVLRRLRSEGLPTRIAMLSAHASDAHITEALQAGAVGYLRKDIAAPELVNAVRAIAKGHRIFSPDIATRLHEHVGLLVNPHSSGLTPREREVLRLFASGLGYRAIAQQLCVSVATVKFHAVNLYQKLRVSSRVEALNRAREWGLLDW